MQEYESKEPEPVARSATEKRCARCKETKPVTQFGQRAASSDGLHPYCRPCIQDYKRLEYDRRKAGRLTERQQLAADGVKRCAGCQDIKPLADFKRQGHLRFYLCKACQRVQRRAARRAALGTEYGADDRLLAQGLKRCGACHLIKDLTAFGDHAKARDGINWWCKTCNNANAGAYYAAHHDDKILYQRAYYEDNKEAIRMASREKRRLLRETDPQAWHALNQAHYRRYGAAGLARVRLWHARHPDAKRAHRRRSYRRHKERHLLHGHRRRVRVRLIAGHWTAQDIALIYEAQRGLCAYCRAPLGPTFHRDHMIPIIRPESTNWPSNLCLSCPCCNRRKHATDAGQYLARLLKERRAQTTV